MPQAYSLIRMSTKPQAYGDSTRRQELLTQSDAVIKAHGLTLNRTLRVIGKSAYNGAHIASGDLAEFIEQVHAGKVAPGSWLIVEAFDRLDRRKTRIALRQFLDLIEAGLVIHIVIDNATYSEERLDDDETALPVSIIRMSEAYKYSEKLSIRLKSKWSARREAAWAGNFKPTNA